MSGSSTAGGVSSTVRDSVVKTADSFGELVTGAAMADPTLFAALTGSAGKNVWAVPVAGLVTWVATTMGLSWSQQTDDAITALMVLAMTGLVHWMTPRPAAGVGAKS